MSKKPSLLKPESPVPPVSSDSEAFSEGFAPKTDSIIIADPDQSITDLFKLVDALEARINTIAGLIKQTYGKDV